MRKLLSVLLFAALLAIFGCTPKPSVKTYSEVRLEFVQLIPHPVIKAGDPGTEDIKFGFEGGTCRKVNGVYYLFTTEVFDEPKTAAVRLAIWKSADGLKFQKHGVIV